MKAYVLTKTNEWRIYGSEKMDIIDVFKFLFYTVDDERILLLASLFLSSEIISHSEIHAQLPKEFIPANQLPVGGGLISILAREAESWESLTMRIKTPPQYREEIKDFLELK